jgi:hypothetical protein
MVAVPAAVAPNAPGQKECELSIATRVQVLDKNEPGPLTKLNVTVPVGEVPVTVAMQGVGGPRAAKGGQLNVMEEVVELVVLVVTDVVDVDVLVELVDVVVEDVVEVDVDELVVLVDPWGTYTAVNPVMPGVP